VQQQTTYNSNEPNTLSAFQHKFNIKNEVKIKCEMCRKKGSATTTFVKLFSLKVIKDGGRNSIAVSVAAL